MDISPPDILDQRKHGETPWMGGMSILQNGILYCLSYGSSFINTQTSVFDAHITPVAIDIGAYIFEPFFVDAISNFLQNGAFPDEECQLLPIEDAIDCVC